MGYTNRRFPIIEIGVLTINYPDHDNERAKEGDIIMARIPEHNVMGTAVWRDRIRLLIEGLEENEYPKLAGVNFDSDIDDLEADDLKPPIYDKRRYCIPLGRLEKIFPSFNINRARDVLDIYQPFMNLDEDTGKYLTPRKPLNVHGLIFDKVKGDYL